VIALLGSACASAPHRAPNGGGVVSFETALQADSAIYAPQSGFRAIADPQWSAAVGSTASAPSLDGTEWRIGDACVVRFDSLGDALARTERAPLPTKRLAADRCHGHAGFWQQSGRNVYWWMALSGGWSAEFFGAIESDSVMALRRFALKADAPRAWHLERASLVLGRAQRLMPEVTTRARTGGYVVTRSPRAIGESDWATRPGAGPTRTVAGSRWQDANGCVLVFSNTVLTRASATARLTRALESTSCSGLRGSWQQAGNRLFWVVNSDSLLAGETYADLVSDTLLRARFYELRRSASVGAWQATWTPSQSRTLKRLKK
jgi:hypothetical protein